ncbi:hypothetical protein Tco_0931318, partial [Tanacetum coccineum]
YHVHCEDQAHKKLEEAQEQERYKTEIEAMYKEVDGLQDKLVEDATLHKNICAPLDIRRKQTRKSLIILKGELIIIGECQQICANGDMNSNDNAHTLKERSSPYGGFGRETWSAGIGGNHELLQLYPVLYEKPGKSISQF